MFALLTRPSIRQLWRNCVDVFLVAIVMLGIASGLWGHGPNHWNPVILSSIALALAPRKVVVIAAIFLFVAARAVFGLVVTGDWRFILLGLGALTACFSVILVAARWHQKQGRELFSKQEDRNGANLGSLEIVGYSLAGGAALGLIWLVKQIPLH